MRERVAWRVFQLSQFLHRVADKVDPRHEGMIGFETAREWCHKNKK